MQETPREHEQRMRRWGRESESALADGRPQLLHSMLGMTSTPVGTGSHGPEGHDGTEAKYITNACPACGGGYEFLEQEIGRAWKCPHCGSPVALRAQTPSPKGGATRTRLCLKGTLRWLLVLPAAAGAWVVALLFCNAFFLMTPFILPEWAKQLVAPGVTSAAFVYAGAKAAPSFQFVTALTLTVLHAVIFTLLFVFILQADQQFRTAPMWWLAITLIPALAATIGVCVSLKNEQEYM